jgi:hypothetical protein
LNLPGTPKRSFHQEYISLAFEQTFLAAVQPYQINALEDTPGEIGLGIYDKDETLRSQN